MVEMTIKVQVKEAQALALQAMFEYWNYLSSVGGSRKVGFYVDGDGDFHPECKIAYDHGNVRPLTDEMKRAAVVEDKGGNRVYDCDNLYSVMDKQKRQEIT